MASSPPAKQSVEKPASVRFVLTDSRKRSSSSTTRTWPRTACALAGSIGLGHEDVADTGLRCDERAAIAVHAAIFQRVKGGRFHVRVEEYLKRTTCPGIYPDEREIVVVDFP